ncbi:hypothetical protein KFE25_005710 [Diacronema lutheri]|uniref:Glycosyltransferase family 25 protein n=1 Tax=Diacronema lutheri TaxID=2081491 RepID=A0A8J5XEF5_DIALT|nr:hypothetical protein KFE25_005710 [Diacronema lutheri]
MRPATVRTVAAWLALLVPGRLALPPPIECGVARAAASHTSLPLIDVPMFVINLDAATESLRRMRARLLPLLAPAVCAHRVPAVTPDELGATGYGFARANARARRVELAISLSHLRAAAHAHALYGNASAVLVVEDDIHFGLAAPRSLAGVAWRPARGGLRAFCAHLPPDWTYAQLQSVSRLPFLVQLRAAWEQAGRPAAMPMAAAEHRPRGCGSDCCAMHTTLGTGAYLLSARGLARTRAWWPLRELTEPRPPAGQGARPLLRRGALTLGGEARACWNLPEAGCERAAAPVLRAREAAGPNVSRGAVGAGAADGFNLAWRSLKLKPSLVADFCLSRPDRYGPPLTLGEALAALAARRPRDTARVRAEWRPYVATPPFVLGERAEQWAAGEPQRLHAAGQWLARTLERGERFVRAWWRDLGGG